MKNKPFLYIIIVLLFSWLTQTLLFTGVLPGNLIVLYMFIPALVAFIFFLAGRDRWRRQMDLFIRRIDPGSFFFALFYPLIWLSLVLVIGVIFGLGRFNAGFLTQVLAPTFIWSFIILIIRVLPTMLGEEYGWRGYLLPGLVERYGKLKATLIVAVVWGIWHIPSYYIAYSKAGMGDPFSLTLLGVLTVAVGAFPYTYLFFRTRNILPCVLLHAVYDMAAGHVFLGTPRVAGLTEGIPGLLIIPWPTAMVLLIVTGAVLAFLFIPRFSER